MYIYTYDSSYDRLGKRPEDPLAPQTQIGLGGGNTHNFSVQLQDFLEWEGHLEIAGLKVFPTTWGGSFWHHDLNDPKASRVMVAYDYEVPKTKEVFHQRISSGRHGCKNRYIYIHISHRCCYVVYPLAPNKIRASKSHFECSILEKSARERLKKTGWKVCKTRLKSTNKSKIYRSISIHKKKTEIKESIFLQKYLIHSNTTCCIFADVQWYYFSIA